MRKAYIIGFLLVTSLVLGACAPAPHIPEPSPVPAGFVELKYDDGTSDGRLSAGWNGFLVHFSPPATPFTISEVRVMAGLHGTGYEERKTELDIWDKDFNLLHFQQEPYTSFSSEPSWVTMEIPNITVNDDFYIVFHTNSQRRESGVYIHYDSSAINEHSEMTSGGGVTDWIWERLQKEKTNWMIRVIGTAMLPPD